MLAAKGSLINRASMLIAALVMFLGGSLCPGQVTSGTILGTVTDPTDAAVVGAKITIVNTDTSVRSEVTSDSKGNFELPYLPNGPYELTIAAAGFESFRQTGIILDLHAALVLKQCRKVHRNAANLHCA
jgi:hypothetical protein